MENPIAIALIILTFTLIVAYKLSHRKSKKKKYIIWGITTIVLIAPLLSWVVSILFAIRVGDGFAGVALLMVMFPLLFLIGLVILLIGIFRKRKAESI
ncbi:hypothetical protein [Bacillus sp. SM2101]|uniref:hypothetical protein n=1 Tax=Bacillus sp. SM2101 TaxID=2805366 RepID=UPI001BDDCAB1|nr:hypothetical protein [Bacillus sp. SM2101]